MHLREFALLDNLVVKMRSGLRQGVVRQPAIYGNHLAAHLLLIYFAGLVFFVASASPLAKLAAHEAAFNLPVEEICPGIAAPQRPVAIKNGNGRLQGEYRFDELGGLAAQLGRAQNCFSEEIRSEPNSRS